MKNLIFYRIATFILLPIGFMTGLSTIQVLFAGLGNPMLMLAAFVNGSVVIYIFSSYLFLRKGLEKKELMKPFMKDLIKVNSYVAIVYGALMFFVSFVVTFVPETLEMAFSQMASQGNLPAADLPKLQKQMMMIMHIALPFSIILLFHIFSTLRLIKQNESLFDSKIV